MKSLDYSDDKACRTGKKAVSKPYRTVVDGDFFANGNVPDSSDGQQGAMISHCGVRPAVVVDKRSHQV